MYCATQTRKCFLSNTNLKISSDLGNFHSSYYLMDCIVNFDCVNPLVAVLYVTVENNIEPVLSASSQLQIFEDIEISVLSSNICMTLILSVISVVLTKY